MMVSFEIVAGQLGTVAFHKETRPCADFNHEFEYAQESEGTEKLKQPRELKQHPTPRTNGGAI